MAEASRVIDAAWLESGAHRHRFGAVRAMFRQLMRGGARAVRPVVGERTFEALYALGRVGYLPRIDAPETFVEKLLWLRRYYRHPLMPQLADKLELRSYVAKVAPECRTPEVFTVAESADAFDFNALPEHAVIKSTHASGHVAFWSPELDRQALRERMAGWLATHYDHRANEWVYAHIRPRLFAEADLRDAEGRPPTDYKLLVFNGVVDHVQLVEGRGEDLYWRYFDRHWRQLPVFRSQQPGGSPSRPRGTRPEKPERFEAMVAAAERLAQSFPFVRVDFYLHDDEMYVGEMTFFPSSGHPDYVPASFDRVLGARLVLPEASSAYVRRET